jgi:hypothetical protein
VREEGVTYFLYATPAFIFGSTHPQHRDDVLVSTLTAYVHTLGGELEIMARFGNHALRLKAASDPRPAIKLKSKRVPRAA